MHTPGEPSLETSRRSGRGWWLLSGLAVVAAVLGAYGLWQYELLHGGHSDAWSILYHTLQLFVLHAPHLEASIPWQLHAGRLLAAVVVFAAVLKTLTRLFRSEWQLLRARRNPRHVVICGLGRVGLQIAREFRRDRRPVVAIEPGGSPERAAAAEAAGIAVLTGDARNADDLRRAGIRCARHVLALCDNEQTNVAVAAGVGELLANHAARDASLEPLECWLFVADPRLRHIFQREGVFPNTSDAYRVNVRGLDLFELAARQALMRYPLDREVIKPTDGTVVRFVIVGFGEMGQQLALQAAKIGHFANDRKLRVTVVERAGSHRVDEFLDRYRHLPEICEFTWERTVPEDRTVTRLIELAASPAGASELVTFALCVDTSSRTASDESDPFQRLAHNDPTNLSLALSLSAATQQYKPHILVFQTSKHGFGALFPTRGRGKAIGARMHAIGMLEDTCTLDCLLHERQDLIAQKLHKYYCDKLLEKGLEWGDKPALFSWERLAEEFRDSNRQAADHIPVKMRSLAYRIDRIRPDILRIETFDDDVVESLAIMEHRRWSASEVLKGTTAGPRDPSKGTHDCLLPWDQLSKETQDYDRQQVRAYPVALEWAGYGIYPQTM